MYMFMFKGGEEKVGEEGRGYRSLYPTPTPTTV